MQTQLSTRLPIVGVIGSGKEPHVERASVIGRWLASQNVHLLTGGGGGVMESVSRAFYEVSDRKGLVLGIIPGETTEAGYIPLAGYPNPWVEIPIYTHLPLSGKKGTDPMSRNHINILSADVIIALPGSAGTASEVALALCYKKPLLCYLDSREQIEDLPADALVETELEKIQQFVLSKLYLYRSGT